jgi:hypothetical protein
MSKIALNRLMILSLLYDFNGAMGNARVKCRQFHVVG